MKTRAALAATLAGLSLATLAAPGAQAAPRPVPTMLIVSVHTDDEMTMSSVWANRTDVKKVFLWLDVTEKGKTRALQPGTRKPVRWNPGEYNPMDFKGGLRPWWDDPLLLRLAVQQGAQDGHHALRRILCRAVVRPGVGQGRSAVTGVAHVTPIWVDPYGCQA